MNSSIVPLAVEPFAETRGVNVQRREIQIQNLTIERQGIVDYLKNVTAGNLEVALVHALEVGGGVQQTPYPTPPPSPYSSSIQIPSYVLPKTHTPKQQLPPPPPPTPSVSLPSQYSLFRPRS